MPATSSRHAILRWAIRGLVLLLLLAACAAGGVVYGWTQVARALPPLQGWHLQAPPSEFMAADAWPGYDFEAYRRQEARVFGEVDELMDGPWPEKRSAVSTGSAPRPPATPPRCSTRTGTGRSCWSLHRRRAARCGRPGRLCACRGGAARP